MTNPLERAFAEAAGPPRPTCPKCGDCRVPGKRLVVVNDESELSKCSECGRYRGPDGEVLGEYGLDGKAAKPGIFKVLVLPGHEAIPRPKPKER